MEEKTCFKCQRTLPLSEFYIHKEMADGRLGKCKTCAKADSTAHRNGNLERVRAYDSERAKQTKRRKAAKIVGTRWRKENPEKAHAQRMVAYHVRRGNMTAQPCARCGAPKTVAHHENYDHPLDVVWLCQACHKARHAEIRREQHDR
jgi:hypothetical protein